MRQRRTYLILVALVIAALAGTAALAATKDPRLGLDLQGGISVVLEAKPPKGRELTSDDLDRSVDIMRERIDKLGVSEPEVRKQDPNQIVIELAGVDDPERAYGIIGQTAQLELYDLESSLTGPSIDASRNPRPYFSSYNLLSGLQELAKTEGASGYLLYKTVTRQVATKPAKKGGKPGTRTVTSHRLMAPTLDPTHPADTRADLLRRYGGKVPKDARVIEIPQKMVVVSCGWPSSEDNGEGKFCPGPNGGFVPTKGQVAYYMFKYEPPDIPQLTGEDLKADGTRQDFDPRTNEPIVLMEFTGRGSDKFQDVTRDLYLRGKLRNNVAQHFAIVLDRDIKSFPQIDPTDSSLAGGISNNAQISGIGSTREAKDLALVLQTGALPVEYSIASTDQVSATLGKDSLREAWIAAIVGLILVAVFLLAFYRFLGLVAVLGLAIYAAFLYATILIFNVTLTLPGFAGMILTIGVAADANVVIFERIKEEVRAGKSVRAAIATGYQKGFHSIIDANVVTMITALVLFAVATAGVRGFALLLLLGTLISMVTAVAATRAFLGLLGGFRWFDSPRFMGAAGEQRAKWMQIDFIRRRNLWFAISGAVLVVCVVSLAVRGMNWGIDFKGGSQITFTTPQPVSLGDVRSQFEAIGEGKAVIQGRGRAVDGDNYRNFQARTESLSTTEQTRLTTELKSEYGQNMSVNVRSVSSSFGRQIARLAIIAVIVSLALIVLYTAIRFGFKFSLPVIAALLHDILITVGIYSLTQREVTTATVAAVLTVLGYSMYDTIIIFDRIRENLPLMRRHSFADIANTSLWEVMRRSLATTFITLLPVACLYAFGGETLQDFAFAILIGVGAGAYSSIFIAPQLLSLWKEREPEFARRRADEQRTGVPQPAALLEESHAAADAEPAPSLLPTPPPPAGDGDGETAAEKSKRERRAQRRRARPHGRAR